MNKIVGVLGVFVVVCVVMYLAGCGGSSGGSSTTAGGGTAAVGSLGGTVYNTAVAVGDLAQVEFNASTNQYAYEIVSGSGQGEKSSGTLTKTHDYLYQDADGSPVIIFPDNVFIAPSGGTGMLVGVPRLTSDYDATAIAGVYNYVELAGTSSQSFSDYTGAYGTFRVNSGGTWDALESGNLGGGASAGSSGTWTDQGNGVLIVKDSSGNKIGNAMLHPNYNSSGTTEKVLIIDLCDSSGSGWYGAMVGVKQQSITSGSVDGTYKLLESDESGLITVTVNGGTATTPGGSMPLNYDSPWQGFINSTADNTLVLISPSGIFFGGGSDSTSAWIFAGIKQ